jgi:uncharacterized membrane protein YeaQ/YmgE (transglycosylase-associated protein family)
MYNAELLVFIIALTQEKVTNPHFGPSCHFSITHPQVRLTEQRSQAVRHRRHATIPPWEPNPGALLIDAENARLAIVPLSLWRCHMDFVPLLIQLISGALGGNIAGSLLKNLSLGTLGNSIAGIVGGGIGGQILDQVFHTAVAGGALDPVAIITQILGGGVGGGVVMAIVGAIRNAMASRA